MAMEKLYFALVDTPGIMAGMIRQVIGLNYVHVAVSLDAGLSQAYSFNRRHPAIPYFSGFVREDASKILRKFPRARYRIISIPCTGEQKRQIGQYLAECYQQRMHYHYSIIGLPFILLHKPFYVKNRYTCSSFAARLLEDHQLVRFNKHFSLVTPRDFYELAGTQTEYEGLLGDYIMAAAPVWKESRSYGT